jgi:hypothetical protein
LLLLRADSARAVHGQSPAGERQEHSEAGEVLGLRPEAEELARSDPIDGNAE